MADKYVVYFEARTILSAATKQYVRELKRDYPNLDFEIEYKFRKEDFEDDYLIPIVDANYHFRGYPVTMKNGTYFGDFGDLYDELKLIKAIALIHQQ